jgi:predicted MFS family arabinose efflux permease
MLSRRRSVLIFSTLSILYFFSIFHRVGIAVISLDIINEFKTDSSILGLMSSMYFWPYALAQIPVGILLDRVGIRKTITALGLIACLGNLIFSLSPSVLFLCLGRALVGFGLGGFYVSALKALAVWYEPKRFATLTGALTAIGNLGGVVASSPLAILALAIGWRGSFLLVFFFMLLFTGVAWFVVKGDEREVFRSSSGFIRDLKRIFSTRDFLMLIIVPLFAYGFFISFQGLWGGPYLSDIYGMGASTIGNFLIFIAIGFMVGVPLGGFISDKIRRRKPVLLAGLLMSISFWLIMSLEGSSLALNMIPPIFFLLGFAFGFDNIYMTISKELFDLSLCGTSMASCNIFAFIGGGFFEYFMGFVLNSVYGGTRVFGAYQLIFVLAVICLGAVFVATLFSREAYPAQTCPS